MPPLPPAGRQTQRDNCRHIRMMYSMKLDARKLVL